MTVSCPRQSAATLRVPSSRASQFSKRGVQRVSEIEASASGDEWMMTCVDEIPSQHCAER